MNTREYDEQLRQMIEAKYPPEEIKKVETEAQQATVKIDLMIINGKVVLAFDQNVKSVGFTPDQARDIAGQILLACIQLQPKHKPRFHRSHGHKGEK